MYRQIKGNTYEEFVLTNLLNDYDNVYYFKDTPEYIIAKTKLYSNNNAYPKYKNCDIGADLVAIKDDQVYFIQCKNYNNTIGINDLCSFYFLILEYELNGIVYYNGSLSERLTDLAQGKIKYINYPYNNTIIDINFTSNEKVQNIARDYQLEIYNEFKNKDKGVIALPCGMGKTYCSWLIGKDYNNIIIISPTRNLSDTNLVQLYNYSPNTHNPILISMDGSRNYKDIKLLLKEKNIISSTYDSVDILNKIIKKITNYIIFVDEFHNLSQSNLENKNDQINKLLRLNKKIIFMSATPINNEKYSKIFGDYIYNYDWKKAIENKYICDFKIILSENTSDVKIFNEFLKNIEYDENNKDLILKSYFILKGINYYGNKKTILYASNINEAKEYSIIIGWMKNILNVKIQTNIIDYTTSKLNRIEYLKKFKINNDQNQMLINVQILNEGIDIPECDSVFITKPNENITNLIQRMCRCNRILPNKKIANIYMWNTNINKILKIFPNLNIITSKINYLNIGKTLNKQNITENIKVDNIDNEYNNDNKLMNFPDYIKNLKTQMVNDTIVFNDKNINSIIDKKNIIWFNAIDISLSLGYKYPKCAIINNVLKKDKCKLEDIDIDYKIKKHPHSIYINSNGLFSLLVKSRLIIKNNNMEELLKQYNNK